MINYSPNTFTLQLSDGSFFRVKPLSMMNRMEFYERSEELFSYLKDLNEVKPDETFRSLIGSDIELNNHINHCLELIGLNSKYLDPDTILVLLFPYVDTEGEQHDRGVLFEKNFPESSTKGKALSKKDIEEQLYKHLAQLTMHFDDVLSVIDMANHMPSEMLNKIAEERSKLMEDSALTKEEKAKKKGKESAKESLQKMLEGN